MITKLNFTDRTIKSYAIRKLTPKECFRLMGVRDKRNSRYADDGGFCNATHEKRFRQMFSHCTV